PFHEAANLFPLLEGEEFEALKADLEAHGQGLPILLHEGKILDGRNRYRACKALGIGPTFREWDGQGGSPLDFVLSMNLDRRQLTAEQRRAVIAAALKENPRQSNRSIAGRVNADHKTVAAVRGGLEAGGEIPHLEEAEGRDGKTYPAGRTALPL